MIEDYRFPSRWSRQKEALVTTFLAWVPLPPGRVIRRLVYRIILKRIGTSAQIDPDVKFVGAAYIGIGNGARIDSGVCLKSLGQNSKIWIGDRARLDRGVDIKAIGSDRIEIGENTYIGPYTCLAGESISVGKDCLIGSHVGIYATNHNFADLTCKLREQRDSFKGIVIGDDCWLGSGVRVVDGVTIHQGSIIGAGAVVTKDIPPYSVAVGVPARAIANRKSSEQVKFTQSKKSIHQNGSHLPLPLSNAFTEVEETNK